MDSKNSKKKAFAVGYNPQEEAPRVLASGSGGSAEYMLRLAEELGVPVRQDSDMVTILDALQVGDFIPEELYHVFALILAELYQINKTLGVYK